MIGRTLSHYRVDAVLGEGGIGLVYRAWDTRLERQVALKVLKARSDADAEAELLREARNVSALNHPHICAVYDVAEDTGLAFIVMELVDGRALSELVAGSPLPPATAIGYGRQIADALAHAHDRGIVHRDLKSANVVISPEGYAKVLDFGLARRLGNVDVQALTQSANAHVIAGTVAYLSPEVLRGEPPDQASDLWALGVVLYEMAAGRLPFQGQTGFELSGAILHEPLPPLLDATPPAFAAVIERSLGKDRARRYRQAIEVRAALETAAASLSRSPSVARAPREAVRPRRSGARTVKSLAVLPMENLSGDPAQEFFADGMTETLIASLMRIGALKVISRTSVMRYKGVRLPLPEIAAELKVDAVIEGSVLRSGDRVRVSAQLIHAATDTHIWAQTYDRALRDVLALQDDVAKAIAGEIQVTLTPQERRRLDSARQVDPQAYELWLKGRHHWNRRTDQHLRTAITYFQQAIDRDAQWALGYVGLADSWNVLGWWGSLPPKEVFPAAKAAAERALALDPNLGEAYSSLGYALHYYYRDWPAAERAFTRALEINPGYPTGHHWFAVAQMSLGRRDLALAGISRAQELDPLALIIQVAHGLIAYMAEDFDLTAAKCRESLGLDPAFLTAHTMLGLAELERGRSDEALVALEEGMRLSNRLDSFALGALAYGLARCGRTTEARGIVGELTAPTESMNASPYMLAAVHVALGEHDQALVLLERAVEERAALVVFLKVDPRFASLRQHPQFAELLERIGLASVRS
jgi:serine/threonine-protein kinase